MPSVVAIVKGERSLDSVYKTIDLISFNDALEPYDIFLIKINLITSHTYEIGITPNPIFVETVIRKVHVLGKKAFVVETEGGITSPVTAIYKTCMMNFIERLGSVCINMRKLDDKVVKQNLFALI